MPFLARATVALSNSPADAELLSYAGLIAQTRGDATEFHFVHVLPEADSLDGPVSVPSHRETLEALRTALDRRLPRSGVNVQVLRGPRVDRLLESAAEARSDFILLGHRRPSPTGRRSLSRRLAMNAPCSLWMVPQGSVQSLSRLMVAVDFSPSSADALCVAARLARNAGASSCRAVYVRRLNAPSGPDEEVARIVGRNEARAFERFLAPLDLDDVRVDFTVEESTSVAAALSRVAEREDAHLILMGTRGLSESSAVLLGAESEQMLIETTRPILLTRQRGERLGWLQVLLDKDLQPANS